MSSLGSLIAQWFGPRTLGPPPPAANAHASGSRREREYPPAEPGLPAVSVAEVIAPQAAALQRLKDAYGADAASFERDIAAVVERYAQFVHLLPATPDAYYGNAGGLFRMGLDVGFFALQGTDSAIFAGRETITQRSALEPRWRYATFLAGLCSELHRTLSHFIVTDNHGHEWSAYLQPLGVWLREQNASRYYVRWRPHPQEARGLTVVALSHIVTPRILQFLAAGNAVVIPHLMASLTGSVLEREANTLDQLVRRASALVIDRDLHANADIHGEPRQGSDLARMVDAMRRLVAKRQWVANAENSRLWYAQDGLFVLWPQAALDLTALLHEDRWPGMPPAATTMMQILAAAGVIEPRADGSLLWDVVIPNVAARSTALKIASPRLLLAATDVSIAALPRRLLEIPAADPTTHATSQGELALSMPAPGPVIAVDRQAPPQPRRAEAPALAVPPPPRSPITLNAPARLSPTVRDALAQIIATLDAPAQPLAAFVVDLGVFVPLKAFEQRRVDPALAVRALSEARMLASDPSQPTSKTLSRDFNGESVLGLVLARECVAGLDPAACGEPAQRERIEP